MVDVLFVSRISEIEGLQGCKDVVEQWEQAVGYQPSLA